MKRSEEFQEFDRQRTKHRDESGSRGYQKHDSYHTQQVREKSDSDYRHSSSISPEKRQDYAKQYSEKPKESVMETPGNKSKETSKQDIKDNDSFKDQLNLTPMMPSLIQESPILKHMEQTVSKHKSGDSDFKITPEKSYGEKHKPSPRADSCLLYTSPSPRDYAASRMPSCA